MIARLALLAALLASCLVRAQPTPEVHGDVGAALDSYLTDQVSPAFSGVVLAVKGGEIVLRKGYGFADREAGLANTLETVFQIGSVTKPLTAVAVMTLVDRGLVDPSEPIATYLDGVPADKRDITVHHLLTHTAGFPGGLGPDYEAIERDAYVRLAMDADLDRLPGEAYEYSNVGYALLAAIVERVTGETYDGYLQRVLASAGITHTGYRLTDEAFARGYNGDDDLGLPFERNWAEDGPYWHLRGNGGLLSTADDLYRLHRAIEEGDLLSDAAVAAMHTPHTDEGPNSSSHYGYGWALFPTPGGGTLAAHNGGDPGFTADFLRFRDDDAVLIVLSNDRAVDAPRLSEPLAEILFGGMPEPFRRAAREPLNLDQLSDGVMGRRALAFVETINAGSAAAARSFTREHLDAGFRRNEDQLVRFFEAVREEMGGAPFRLERAEWDGEEGTMVLFTTLPNGRSYRAELGFQPGDERRIEGLFTDYTDADAAPLPDTPAGRTVGTLLDALNGDDAALRAFISSGLDPGLREAHSEEEHLALLRRMRDDLVGADITDIDGLGDYTLTVVAEQASGRSVALRFEVAEAPPHGLVGVSAEGR